MEDREFVKIVPTDWRDWIFGGEEVIAKPISAGVS